MQRGALHAAIAVFAGIAHASLILGVVLHYGYEVGSTAYEPHIAVWRYGGLIVLGAVPVWLALTDRLIAPLVVLVALAGYAVGAELTPPGPTFHDIADLEPGIQGHTGSTVVENGLYLVKYMSAWYIWTIALILTAGWEHHLRSQTRWLPPPQLEVDRPTTRQSAFGIAVAAGCLHALGSIGYAWGLGLFDTPLFLAWAAIGGILLVAIPTYLLIQYHLVWPLAIAILLFLNSIHSHQYAGPGDPHALYVAGWIAFLAIPLLAAGIEYTTTKLYHKRLTLTD